MEKTSAQAGLKEWARAFEYFRAVLYRMHVLHTTPKTIRDKILATAGSASEKIGNFSAVCKAAFNAAMSPAAMNRVVPSKPGTMLTVS